MPRLHPPHRVKNPCPRCVEVLAEHARKLANPPPRRQKNPFGFDYYCSTCKTPLKSLPKLREHWALHAQQSLWNILSPFYFCYLSPLVFWNGDISEQNARHNLRV